MMLMTTMMMVLITGSRAGNKFTRVAILRFVSWIIVKFGSTDRTEGLHCAKFHVDNLINLYLGVCGPKH